ncbi:MAG: hypothetical protein HRT68_16580 [Flavobacteriaceae bacterium]|nr:hypothetical protein [Flavobacteriaceae bacterium]
MSWDELHKIYQKSVNNQQKLALNYSYDEQFNPSRTVKELIGIAKYIDRTAKVITKEQLKERLLLSDRSFGLALDFLRKVGFLINEDQQTIEIKKVTDQFQDYLSSQKNLLDVLKEENFKRKYFTQIPLETLQKLLVYENIN